MHAVPTACTACVLGTLLQGLKELFSNFLWCSMRPLKCVISCFSGRGEQALCKNSGSTLGYGFGSSTVDLDDDVGASDDGAAPRVPLAEALA